ncbi:hypothetical protein BDP81DRAFT_191186 [Colletotrichum phormii]|uniref:Uncharacterized protein n=1 Tax=Colletotrichum phormii TaxID=359342 RepID=A0AAI9ZV88_9PEZI|nr:uncharacterized protein BDP81DRAFT_191186 [Colletotrichum phormii]KAK1638773.1 hypothetical protein BDP81DRAFT_191186 [Colletotrichum phormii]
MSKKSILSWIIVIILLSMLCSLLSRCSQEYPSSEAPGFLYFHWLVSPRLLWVQITRSGPSIPAQFHFRTSTCTGGVNGRDPKGVVLRPASRRGSLQKLRLRNW